GDLVRKCRQQPTSIRGHLVTDVLRERRRRQHQRVEQSPLRGSSPALLTDPRRHETACDRPQRHFPRSLRVSPKASVAANRASEYVPRISIRRRSNGSVAGRLRPGLTPHAPANPASFTMRRVSSSSSPYGYAKAETVVFSTRSSSRFDPAISF